MTQVANWYFDEDGDLIVVTADGTKYKCVNPWLSSVTWHGLDNSTTEVVTIENTIRYG